VDGVDHALPLKLHPHSIGAWSWEGNVELELGTSVCNERVRVHKVDQVVTGGKHMTPCPEVFFQSVICRKLKA
jgi:hypothetical protein